MKRVKRNEETGERLAALLNLPRRDRTCGTSSPLRRSPEAGAPRTVGVRKSSNREYRPSRHPQGPTVQSLPPLVFRGAEASSKMLRVWLFPATFQDTEHLTSPHQSKVSKLVPLPEKLAAWKLLPNISPWVERTVDKGYRIQFAYWPPRFNGVVSSSVKPERVHLLTQELQALLEKGAIERVPLPDRGSGYYRRDFRSSRVELLPQNIQVKNVDNQDECVSDSIGGFVRDNRS